MLRGVRLGSTCCRRLDFLTTKLCEQCHEREATCHSTTVVDGAAVSVSLCDECFASSAEADVSDLYFAGMTARCRYCGEPAVCGGMDALESLEAGRARRSWGLGWGGEVWRRGVKNALCCAS